MVQSAARIILYGQPRATCNIITNCNNILEGIRWATTNEERSRIFEMQEGVCFGMEESMISGRLMELRYGYRDTKGRISAKKCNGM